MNLEDSKDQESGHLTDILHEILELDGGDPIIVYGDLSRLSDPAIFTVTFYFKFTQLPEKTPGVAYHALVSKPRGKAGTG